MSKEFKWDDKSIEEMLVRAFSERMFQGLLKTPKQVIEDFKASHSTEDKNPEWEIVKVGSKDNNWDICLFQGDYVSSIHKIHSVRRLSDNSVWSVGDVLDRWGEITSFKIQSNKFMLAQCNNRGNTCHVFIEDFSKLPQRTKLFTTEDGWDVFEGDSVWYYDLISYSVNVIFNLHRYTREPRYKYFSTTEKAEEYRLMNKPLLSVNDALSWATFEESTRSTIIPKDIDRLKELAKSKL